MLFAQAEYEKQRIPGDIPANAERLAMPRSACLGENWREVTHRQADVAATVHHRHHSCGLVRHGLGARWPARPPCRDLPVSRRRVPNKDRKSTRLNSSHQIISYAVFCLKKK